jgi:hypothetical protein
MLCQRGPVTDAPEMGMEHRTVKGSGGKGFCSNLRQIDGPGAGLTGQQA